MTRKKSDAEKQQQPSDARKVLEKFTAISEELSSVKISLNTLQETLHEVRKAFHDARAAHADLEQQAQADAEEDRRQQRSVRATEVTPVTE